MRNFIDIVEGISKTAKSDFGRDVLPARIPDTEENIKAAKEFVMRKWIERWHEGDKGSSAQYRKMAATGKFPHITRDWYEPPSDLTNSCKFTSLFAREIFGGQLEGNYDHQFVRAPDGKIIDLNVDAADVKVLGRKAYRFGKMFWGSPDHQESVISCMPRVEKWVQEFLTEIGDHGNMIKEGIDFDEPPYVDTEHGEPDYAARSEAILSAVAEFSRNLPIRVEMRPYKNRYSGAIQGVVLTDLYADNPGDGAGTKIMRFMTGLADRAEINIYTDAEGPRSKAFYEKFGFVADNHGGHMLVYYPPLPEGYLD